MAIRYSRYIVYMPETLMNTWTTPAYTEISMSAEIGGYQDDFDERVPKPEEAIRRGDDPSSVPNEA
jgi:coenzyme PQQ precursor peptide PqqA